MGSTVQGAKQSEQASPSGQEKENPHFPTENEGLSWVAGGGIEPSTHGFSVHLSPDKKKEIFTSLPPEGGGKNFHKDFKEITRKALKKRRKK